MVLPCFLFVRVEIWWFCLFRGLTNCAGFGVLEWFAMFDVGVRYTFLEFSAFR